MGKPAAPEPLPTHWLDWLSWRVAAERRKPSLLYRLFIGKPKPTSAFAGIGMLIAGGSLTCPRPTNSKRRRS